MKVALPGILAGVGGIGAVGTSIGVIYHRPEVEDSRENHNNENNDAKFEELKKEIEEFAGKCQDKSKDYGKTVLEELRDIFKMLLEEQYSGGGTSNLDARKKFLNKRLTDDERKLFKDLYEEMEKFSEPLRSNQEKSSKYKKKLEKNN